MNLLKRSATEWVGTFWLVLGGCGSAVLAAAFPHVGIGLLGVALAFGLTVLTMAFGMGIFPGVISTRRCLSACGSQVGSQPKSYPPSSWPKCWEASLPRRCCISLPAVNPALTWPQAGWLPTAMASTLQGGYTLI